MVIYQNKYILNDTATSRRLQNQKAQETLQKSPILVKDDNFEEYSRSLLVLSVIQSVMGESDPWLGLGLGQVDSNGWLGSFSRKKISLVFIKKT